MLPFGMLEVGVFLFGTIIGSFLTVCIYRLPLDQSIVLPRSACPQCKRTIPWYDNVPLLSFVLLRGRCRNCQTPIPYRYPVVELINGMGYLAILWRFGWGWPAVAYGVFFSALVTIAWIDLNHLIIPDVITVPGILLGVGFSAWILPVGLVNSLLGVLIGGGVLWVIAWLSPLVFGKEGLGGGDIKLLAMVGAFLGWQYALGSLMVASIVGALVGAGLMAVRMLKLGQHIPFGPFLAIGAMTFLLYGSQIMVWYRGVVQ